LTVYKSGSLLVVWDGMTPGSRDPDGSSVRSRLFEPSALFVAGKLRGPGGAAVAPPPSSGAPNPDQRPCKQAGAGTPGAACTCELTCQNDAFCAKQEAVGDPGGTCYIPCTADAECPAGRICGVGTGYCASGCKTHADCPVGRECFGGGCEAFCKDDSVCGAAKCDLYSRLCSVGTNGGGGLYAPCAKGSDCRSGHCGVTHPETGRCWSSCWPSLGGCPEGAVCIEWAPAGPDWGSCLLPCPDGKCPAGLNCEPMGAQQVLVCTSG
jgi:hypothetical protein